jgi:hypothetical protein
MWIPEKRADGTRRYRVWAGNPAGTPEDLTRCAASVADDGRSPLFHQCFFKRGKGPNGELCGTHARMIERRAKATGAS